MISLDTNALVRMLIEDDEEQFLAVLKVVTHGEKFQNYPSSVRSSDGNDLGS